MTRLILPPKSHYNDRVSFRLPHFAIGFVLLTCLLAKPGLGYFGGNGTVQNPYLIAAPADLVELGQSIRDYDKHFLLVNDIDLSGYTFDQAVIAPLRASSFEPDAHYFSGTINGNGHVIRNLTVSGKGHLGLFGVLHEHAQIYGLGVVDADISGTADSIGILAGYSEGSIFNCFSSGRVSGQSHVGGLIGESQAWGKTIKNSYSTAHVHGDNAIGGFVGGFAVGEIIHCYSTGRVVLNGTDPNALVAGCFRPARRGNLNCFWDVQTSGIPDILGLPETVGLSTEQMQDVNTFLTAGWDFLGESTNGDEDIWLIPEGGGYPELSIFHGFAPKLPSLNGVTVGQCTLSLDPNEVLWNASMIFQPSWTSVALTKITRNPIVYSNVDPNEQDMIITISGKIDTLDTTNLIDLDSQNSVVCQVFDDAGRDIAFRDGLSPFESELRHCWDILDTSPSPFTLHLQLDPDQPIPSSLSELNFFIYALYAQPLASFEVPFTPMDTWMELLPGFRIWIEKAVSDGNQCEYIIREEINAASDSFGPYFSPGYNACDLPFIRALENYNFIYNFEVLDSEGNPTSHRGRTTNSSSGGKTTRTATWTSCSGIDVIRYTIAAHPYQRLVPLTLVDIPLNNL